MNNGQRKKRMYLLVMTHKYLFIIYQGDHYESSSTVKTKTFKYINSFYKCCFPEACNN